MKCTGVFETVPASAAEEKDGGDGSGELQVKQSLKAWEDKKQGGELQLEAKKKKRQ